MNYADVIDRVVALPVALTWEPGLVLKSCAAESLAREQLPGRLWGFRVLHTSNVMEGECHYDCKVWGLFLSGCIANLRQQPIGAK